MSGRHIARSTVPLTNEVPLVSHEFLSYSQESRQDSILSHIESVLRVHILQDSCFPAGSFIAFAFVMRATWFTVAHSNPSNVNWQIEKRTYSLYS
jgi:hypothetical protein